jgi:hypothetical protein
LGFAPGSRVDAQLSHSLAHRLSRPRLRRTASARSHAAQSPSVKASDRQGQGTCRSKQRLVRHLVPTGTCQSSCNCLNITCIHLDLHFLSNTSFSRLVRPLSEVTQLGGQLRASSVHIPNLALHRRLNGHRSQEQSPSVCHYGVQYRVAGCKLLLPSLRAFHASCRSLLLTETPFTWAIGTRCHGALCIQESER